MPLPPSPLRAGRLARVPGAADAVILAGPRAPLVGPTLRLVVWNVHWGAGDTLADARRFDGDAIRWTLDSIGAEIRRARADVVALQEVDRLADRSARVDQLEHLRDATGLHHAAFVTTWDAGWVPYPLNALPHRQYGRVLSGQAVLSRFPVVSNARLALPQPRAYGRVHNHFYLHRCIQEVTLDLGARRRLSLLNVHLEAFDQRNRRLHARRVAERMAALPGPALAVGDFNAVPPESAQRHGFYDEPHTDMRGDDSIEVLRATGWTELGAGAFTFPAGAPNRRLDHMFAHPSVQATDVAVLEPDPPPSDHLPLCATLRL